MLDVEKKIEYIIYVKVSLYNEIVVFYYLFNFFFYLGKVLIYINKIIIDDMVL